MFFNHFQESFPKLIEMRNKEKMEGMEKRLKEVNKLINKRKKKLEIDHSPQAEIETDNIDVNERDPLNQLHDTKPLNIQADLRKSTEEANLIDKADSDIRKSTDQNIGQLRPKGGDPHGAMQKIHEKALAEAREKIENQNNAKVGSLFSLINRKRKSNKILLKIFFLKIVLMIDFLLMSQKNQLSQSQSRK